MSKCNFNKAALHIFRTPSASKYGHPVRFQSIKGSDIYVPLLFIKRGPVITSHEGSSQEDF